MTCATHMFAFGFPLAASDHCLSQLKFFLADNSFVHTFNDDPILLILSNGLS